MSQDRQQTTSGSSRKRLTSQEDRVAEKTKQHHLQQQQQREEHLLLRDMKTRTKLVANLHSAANEGKVELVRLLLRCGADANAQDEQFGNTALHQAAWNGFSQTVQVLCKYRANTSVKNKAKFTPLHMASQQGHNQTARLLLMAGAKSEAKNSYGDTPLHTAARYGHAGVARILLSAKSDPNQVNKNHDTPLHIAAAMNRRKLTKIFMQNGAEPAIKNKQNETPMDIALRKDLIDIQELIANPPAANNAGQTTTGGRQANHCHAHTQYSGLYGSPVGEQRGYGQLYGGRQSARHAHPAGRTRRTRRRNHGAHGGASSDDSAASELEQRLARMRLHSGGAQNPSRTGRRLRAGDRCGTTNELAVDVPEELVRTGPLTRSAAFSSLHSIGAQATSAAHQQRRHGGASHLRTQRATIGASSSGADLHLLPTLLSTRLHTTQRPRAGLFPNSTAATSRRRTTGSVDLEQPDADDADNEGCAPDARDNPADWADIMATSALYKRQQTVIEADDEIGGHDDIGKSPEASKSVGKEPSPNASFRSSLSKSRGRLLVRRRKQKASLLVRRPNLGTCVGKLSLVRLRAMVNKRSSPQRANNRSTSPDGAMGQPENEETIHSGKIPSASKPVAAGRRQERLERLRDSGEQRAPNGIQLLATRPLAALGDTTQLYAIPKKNKSTVASKQQVADSKAAAAEAADRAAQLKQPPPSAVSDGGSPNGPALTSDGGHSSAGSSSSADMASSSDNIAAVSHLDIVCASNGKRSQLLGASLPATPPALVGVHGADRDLYASAAPGYSTVRELPLHNGAADNESSEPCLCHAGYQQQVGDKSCHLPDGSAPAAAAGTSSSSLQPASQPPPLPPQQQKQQQQQPQTTGEAKGRQQAEQQQQQQVAASKTSRLRQLLHLESRPKQDRCKANTTTASTVIITDEVHRPNATDVSPAPDGRLPMSAIAGGYYAYSPVVQSSSELKPAEQHPKQSGAGHESDKSNGSRSSGAKKSWLMSRFSLSSSTATLSNGSSHQVSSSNDLPNQQGITTHSQQQHLDTQVSNRTGEESALDGNAFASNALLGPERKAELITISSSDLTNRHLFHAPGEASTGHEHEQPVGRLIRPKSALSATSADLIAAQKSLATAAAAKVHRDRLVKLIDQNHQDEQQQQQPDESNNKDGVLTVKTSEPFWSHLHHAQPVDAAAKYMIGQPMIATSGHHRSGTNSVGMSDSSPSNNGAESDNSIQTTSGSANTDTASQQNSNGQNPSPLGILSRILLNNKSLGYSSRQSAGNGSQSSQQVTDESSVKSSNESSTLRDNSATNGSISSSQSSPLSSNQSPGSSNGLADKPLAKLDQLASRSRRPIVMTSSNDSGNASEKKTQTARDAQSSPQNPPPLPAKGVLKTTGLKSINRINIGPSIISESALNGLPQVSPFSQQQQISNFANNNNKITADPQHQPLCNYHALGQPRANHLPHYAGPYSPYPTQTRYTFQEASQQKPLVGAKYAPHHLSHHELTTSPRSHDLTLPASAINYEYYLDSPLTAAYHQHLNQSSSAFQFGPEIGAPANNDNPIYSSYPQDYSIYVPHAIRPGGGGGDSGGGVSHSQTQTLDNSSQATGRFSS